MSQKIIREMELEVKTHCSKEQHPGRHHNNQLTLSGAKLAAYK